MGDSPSQVKIGVEPTPPVPGYLDRTFYRSPNHLSRWETGLFFGPGGESIDPWDDWLDLAGKYRDDPMLDEICNEAYRARNADSGP
jgi:hypothetical protein